MRVLLAEDNAVSRRLLESLLRKLDYEVTLAPDGDEAWSALRQPDGPCLAVLDWEMPGLDGIEICRRVRAQAREPYVYLVLLTAREGRESLLEGLQAGADDFLRKPPDEEELDARLRAGRRIVELQAQLVAAREALREQATHDALTGLLNRRALLDALERGLARSRREGTPLSVVLLDLDHFKPVNDTFGHNAGDLVLREAATRLRHGMRGADAVGRWGGEEFLAVLPGCDLAYTCQVAERLRAEMAAAPVALRGGRAVDLTCSIGCAGTAGGEVSIEELIAKADAALYRAKQSGRNRVEPAPGAGGEHG